MKRFFIFLTPSVSLLFLASKALAQCAPGALVNGKCTSVNTALGPIGTDPGSIVGSVMGILLSIAGGVAILLIAASGYQLVISQGNPEKVKAARERLASAIVGLLFIIFSVAILQFIGITILHVPGLTK